MHVIAVIFNGTCINETCSLNSQEKDVYSFSTVTMHMRALIKCGSEEVNRAIPE